MIASVLPICRYAQYQCTVLIEALGYVVYKPSIVVYMASEGLELVGAIIDSLCQ